METTKKITLQGMILWAKDRLLDDMSLNSSMVIGYWAMTSNQRKVFTKNLTDMVALLNLPENDIKSLKKLAKAGYFNGDKDTIWEWAEVPDWFKKKWAAK